MMRYAVIFEKAAYNWAAYVPDLPGCVTTGKTLEDTRRLIVEAIQFHMEGMRLHGEPVPEPSTRAEEIQIGDAA
jgi:predicted RNase H-like HicB family nuclease